MKRLTSIFVIAFLTIAYAFAESDFPLRNMSYSQRGILNVWGEEYPVSVRVLSGENEVKMMFEVSGATAARVVLKSDGELSFASGSAIFSEGDVRNFVVRDLRAALGFLDTLCDGDVRIRKDNFGRVLQIDTDNLKMTFLNFITFNGRSVPQRLEIRSGSYSLTLHASAFKIKKLNEFQ